MFKILITLGQILNLVGKLDDSNGDGTPRERFRDYLSANVQELGQVRNYIDFCLVEKGGQYNRALQDLINHLGGLMGFEVTFGRYSGIRNQIGFDGIWKSKTGFYIVVEVKTTQAYAIKTSTLLGYINDLISEKKIPKAKEVLGLYITGRPDSELRQLENSIIAEGKENLLRIISTNSLISLAEIMTEYDVTHEDALAILRPSGPNVDQILDLMTRLVVTPSPREIGVEEKSDGKGRRLEEYPLDTFGPNNYWLTPVRSDKEKKAEEVIKTLVSEEGIYAYGDRTPGRNILRPGDWICFYATGKGAIGHAKVMSRPEKKPHPKVINSEKYPWTFRVDEAKLYLDNPKKIDLEMRKKLDAFKRKPFQKTWGWFLYTTRKISEKDFKLITREFT